MMPMPPRAGRVSSSELEPLDNRVTRAGGAIGYLEGARYGIATSVYHSQVPPGAGPGEHTHPYVELWVLHDGQARCLVGGSSFDAEAGDVVIVPPDTPHSFVNNGGGPLRQTAIHEAPVHDTRYRDESTS